MTVNNELMDDLKTQVYDKCVELFGGTITPSRLDREVNEMRHKLHKVGVWLHHHRRIPTDGEDWDLILEVLVVDGKQRY